MVHSMHYPALTVVLSYDKQSKVKILKISLKYLYIVKLVNKKSGSTNSERHSVDWIIEIELVSWIKNMCLDSRNFIWKFVLVNFGISHTSSININYHFLKDWKDVIQWLWFLVGLFFECYRNRKMELLQ